MITPVTYYGGKQQMAKLIVNCIPPHSVYVEPFCGGCAVFFAKSPARIEVINDINGEAINFYKVLQNDFESLQKEVKATLHSRAAFVEAKAVYRNPDAHDKIKRAWAFWCCSVMGYAGLIGRGGWGYGRTGHSLPNEITNKRNDFTHDLARRLEQTQIECNDAFTVIKAYDTPETFFYVDPPYIGADQGHYKGYTEESFRALLLRLSKIQGRFILSSYPSSILDEYIEKCGWYSFRMGMNLHVNVKKEQIRKGKIEVLTANYPISKDGCNTRDLFSHFEEEEYEEAYEGGEHE